MVLIFLGHNLNLGSSKSNEVGTKTYLLLLINAFWGLESVEPEAEMGNGRSSFSRLLFPWRTHGFCLK